MVAAGLLGVLETLLDPLAALGQRLLQPRERELADQEEEQDEGARRDDDPEQVDLERLRALSGERGDLAGAWRELEAALARPPRRRATLC